MTTLASNLVRREAGAFLARSFKCESRFMASLSLPVQCLLLEVGRQKSDDLVELLVESPSLFEGLEDTVGETRDRRPETTVSRGRRPEATQFARVSTSDPV